MQKDKHFSETFKIIKAAKGKLLQPLTAQNSKKGNSLYKSSPFLLHQKKNKATSYSSFMMVSVTSPIEEAPSTEITLAPSAPLK